MTFMILVDFIVLVLNVISVAFFFDSVEGRVCILTDGLL
jgi:hypothetical protein